MRLVLCTILIFLAALACPAAITKTQNTEAMDWSKATLGTVLSAEVACGSAYATTLHIDVGLAGTTAHLGVEIIVQVASEVTVNDAWSDLTRFVGLIGTATKSDFGANEAAAQTELSITNPATGNLDHNGKFVFIYPADDANIASCEIAYQTANTGDAGDTITVLNGIHNAQTVDTDIYTIDGAGGIGSNEAVLTRAVAIPPSITRARVIINNAYGATGSTVIARVRATQETGI